MHTSSQQRYGILQKFGPIVFGIVLFGALMALRDAFTSTWVRMTVACCAGAVLGWTLIPSRKQ